MTRAIETLISAWVAEQERERIRRRIESGAPVPLPAEPERDAASRSEDGAPPMR
jgi:hypothetical protein